MWKEKYPLYLGSEPLFTDQFIDVNDKFTGRLLSRVAAADTKLIDEAIRKAVAAKKNMAALAPYERRAALLSIVEGVKKRADEFAQVLCLEAGKPLRDAKNEIARMVDTFTIAADEAVRAHGELVPMGAIQRSKDFFGAWKRVPVGVCSFIVPFNFPFNLAAHKIAPAIAAGCPFVMKPASYTPISGALLGELLAEAKLPAGAFSILPCHRDGAELFTTDERFNLLSFTGSPAVGWELKKQAGKKKVVLELGGNAACIVEKDAPLDLAVERIAVGAFAQSGQSCISVQRVFIQKSVYDAFAKKLLARVAKVKCGNPADEAVEVGPLISEKDAQRLETWVNDAVKAGAKLLCGGERQGAVMTPAVLEGVDARSPLCAEEAFGPILVIAPYEDYENALDLVNDTKFGLQAGVFTSSLEKAHLAWDRLEVGGVMINEVPTFRVDHMPYGGVKDSGLGREGVRFAMEDMTEIRMFAARLNVSH